jgi:hypothetical protein
MYSQAVVELENSLLENSYGSDTIKMKMRGKAEMPIVNRLINVLSMVEAKTEGKFNIGVGNGDAKVKSVVAPFCKVSESAAIVLVDNKFIKLTENDGPVQVEMSEVSEHAAFYQVCEAFSALNFQEKEAEIVSYGRRLEVAFAVNESGNLYLKINGKRVDDLTSIDTAELFLMEQIETRARLTTLFNNLDMIVNLEFAKRLVNERLGSDSIVFTIDDTQYVFEKVGQTRVVKKMQGLTFHNYVMENFKYDVSELYQIELEERERFLRQVDEDKSVVEKDLVKLEGSIAQIEEALKDKSLSADQQLQLEDLKIAIEKSANSLKNHYIELDQSKKKSLNEAEDITLVSPQSSKYSAGQMIVLADGRSGRIVGVDPITQSYQVMTSDHKSIRVKGSDISRIEKKKDTDYQESGVSKDNDKELAIKETPFDLDQEK